MNAKDLAEKMLEFSNAQTKANELKVEIEAAVMELEKTQEVGNVKATYRKPRKTYLYEDAAKLRADHSTLDKHTKVTKRIDWREICKELDIEAGYKESAPSVTVKLV
ncbi:MAG: hypothetical protein GY755_02120 [Chloroflexi bacterium]|nr:hypothetical protein [Chloroflexota bacterium]